MMPYSNPLAPAPIGPTGVVKGACDDHFFYTDTVNGYGYWESDRYHIVKAPEDGYYGSRNTCGPGATVPVPTVPVPAGASMRGLDDDQAPHQSATTAAIAGAVAGLLLGRGSGPRRIARGVAGGVAGYLLGLAFKRKA